MIKKKKIFFVHGHVLMFSILSVLSLKSPSSLNIIITLGFYFGLLSLAEIRDAIKENSNEE